MATVREQRAAFERAQRRANDSGLTMLVYYHCGDYGSREGDVEAKHVYRVSPATRTLGRGWTIVGEVTPEPKPSEDTAAPPEDAYPRLAVMPLLVGQAKRYAAFLVPDALATAADARARRLGPPWEKRGEAVKFLDAVVEAVRNTTK